MNDKPPQPAAQRRHEQQVMQQAPKQKLTIVWTLDGVSAQSLLTYETRQVGPKPGKTNLSLSAQERSGDSSARQRHQAQVREAVRSLQANRSHHEDAVARTQQVKQAQERNLSHERDR